MLWPMQRIPENNHSRLAMKRTPADQKKILWELFQQEDREYDGKKKAMNEKA